MYQLSLQQESLFNGGFVQRSEPPAIALTSIYMNVPNSSVAREFAHNFDHFRRFGSDVVTRPNLEWAAGREPMGDNYVNRMTSLARELLSRPEVSQLLNNQVSRGDADAMIMHFDQREAPLLREVPKRYSSGLQQRPDGQFNFRLALQPSPRQPALDGQYANRSQWNGPAQASGNRPYANDSKEDFSNKILARFSAFEDPNSPGMITDKSLSAVASGYRLDGQPATQKEVDLANELLERGGLFKELDQSSMGVMDGAFSRGNLQFSSDKYRNMSDQDLLQGVKDNFRQFTAGANDKYVSVNELKEAAGQVSSNRTFSSQAQQLAAELLRRPGLLRDLDIGIKVESGKPGAEDQRFDIDNLNHMLGKS